MDVRLVFAVLVVAALVILLYSMSFRFGIVLPIAAIAVGVGVLGEWIDFDPLMGWVLIGGGIVGLFLGGRPKSPFAPP